MKYAGSHAPESSPRRIASAAIPGRDEEEDERGGLAVQRVQRRRVGDVGEDQNQQDRCGPSGGRSEVTGRRDAERETQQKERGVERPQSPDVEQPGSDETRGGRRRAGQHRLARPVAVGIRPGRGERELRRRPAEIPRRLGLHVREPRRAHHLREIAVVGEADDRREEELSREHGCAGRDSGGDDPISPHGPGIRRLQGRRAPGGERLNDPHDVGGQDQIAHRLKRVEVPAGLELGVAEGDDEEGSRRHRDQNRERFARQPPPRTGADVGDRARRERADEEHRGPDEARESKTERAPGAVGLRQRGRSRLPREVPQIPRPQKVRGLRGFDDPGGEPLRVTQVQHPRRRLSRSRLEEFPDLGEVRGRFGNPGADSGVSRERGIETDLLEIAPGIRRGREQIQKQHVVTGQPSRGRLGAAVVAPRESAQQESEKDRAGARASGAGPGEAHAEGREKDRLDALLRLGTDEEGGREEVGRHPRARRAGLGRSPEPRSPPSGAGTGATRSGCRGTGRERGSPDR